jgi:hypothetical protein
MTPSAPRSLWTVLTVTVIVGFAVSLVGCASAGYSPVAVSDVKSVAGMWKGIIYDRSEVEANYVELTIREDGSYDVVSARPVGAIGVSRGKGKIVISEGRLLFEGERGRGVGTLLRSRGGDLIMNVDATLSDNSTLSAELSRSR